IMKKTITLTVFLLLCTTAAAQENVEVPESKKLYLKANAVFLPVGIINAGAEYQLSEKMTIQGDVFISPWKSFLGKYAQCICWDLMRGIILKVLLTNGMWVPILAEPSLLCRNGTIGAMALIS